MPLVKFDARANLFVRIPQSVQYINMKKGVFFK